MRAMLVARNLRIVHHYIKMLGRSLINCRRANAGEAIGRHAAVHFAVKRPYHHRFARKFVCGQRRSKSLRGNFARDSFNLRRSYGIFSTADERNTDITRSHLNQAIFFSSVSNSSEPVEASKYEKEQVLRFMQIFGMTTDHASRVTKKEYEFFKLGKKHTIGDIIEAFKKYDEDTGGATELMYCMLIQQCGRNNVLEVALVRDMFKVHGRPKSAYIYNMLFQAYGKMKGNFDEVERIRSIMKVEGVKATTETYNILIHAYGAYCDNYDKVYELYEEMDSPDTVTYNTLLNLHSDKSRHSKSKRDFFLAEMKSKNIEPDIVTYSSLLKSFGYDMAELQMYLQEMKDRKLKFDIVTYSTLIQVYAYRFRDMHRMERVYAEMKNDGIYPDLYAFNALISLYAKLANRRSAVEKAERILEDMESAGVSKDTETYNSLLLLYGRAKENRKVEIYNNEMVTKRIKKNVYTYTALITAYARYASNRDVIEKCLMEMIENNITPNNVLFNVLIRFYGRANDRKAVKAIIKQMDAMGIHKTRNTFQYMIEFAVFDGDLDEAENIFKMLENDQRATVDGVVYNTILRGFIYANDATRRDLYFSKMLDDGFNPDPETKKLLRQKAAGKVVASKFVK